MVKRDFYASLPHLTPAQLDALEDLVDHHEGADLWDRLTRPRIQTPAGPLTLRTGHLVYADELVGRQWRDCARPWPHAVQVIE